MKNMKKTVWASALALLVCCTLLLGSTFAWFTDSATNSGNSITSGNMDVRFFGNKLVNGTWESLNPLETKGPLIDDTNWEPGQYGAAVIGVSNFHSSVAAKVDVDFTITDGKEDLANALWYRIVPITSTQATAERADVYNMLQYSDPATRPDSTNTEVKSMANIEDETNEVVVKTSGEKYAFYLIEYGMYTDAGNEYQNLSFGLDFTVNATQAPVEDDAFGNTDYDADAQYAA